jgi:hypothetical protein
MMASFQRLSVNYPGPLFQRRSPLSVEIMSREGSHYGHVTLVMTSGTQCYHNTLFPRSKPFGTSYGEFRRYHGCILIITLED